jgi:REP element-mobilizing transposase RayT
MSRPLRIEYPNACYHVINRGDNRREIFNSSEDYTLFLDKLASFSEVYNIKIRAYCLMPNHFHLYLQTPEGNLSRFMQALLTSFTSIKNHRQKTSGHLFQGRFKSLVVEDKSYGMTLCRYIHLNPVNIKKFSDSTLAVKRNVLRKYKWSSYPMLIGLKKTEKWLDADGNYPWPGLSGKDKQKKYAVYVEKGLQKNLDDFKEHVKAQAILGSDSFTEMLKRKYIDLKTRIGDCPQAKKLSSFKEVDDIAKVIAIFYGEKTNFLFLRCKKGNEARQALIHFSEIYCRGKYTLTELAEKLNLSIGGYSSCRRLIRTELAKNKKIKKRFNELNSKLGNVKC